MSFIFETSTGRYRNTTTGKFTSRETLLRIVDNEVMRLETRLKGHARLLIANKITPEEWEERMRYDMKLSGICTGLLTNGGKERATPQILGGIGNELRNQYKYLSKFKQQIKNGELTSETILRRAGNYSGSSRMIYHQNDKRAKQTLGFTLARRILDAGANHCNSCIQYQRLAYVPISEIVPVATNCECKWRCRCRIIYKK